ncbi:MAG: iron chaperone [Bacteroidota bacterium]
MPSPKRTFATIKEYERTLPVHSKTVLKTIRTVIAEAIPGIEGTISYNIPTFKYEGRIIVSVGVWKDHIGMYPVPSGSAAFNKAIERYKKSKSSVHFPLDEPLPLKLITAFVKRNYERKRKITTNRALKKP